ncbi:uncharacterized protein LOC117283255 [Fukomys damarensis]|uniref:uncharacterized protein LOC117283255 n=1 Tax=Fukomys damarensis TaxID=885580 RepID=UPI0014557DEA|nr:uncharacterized protein LOC117283255 [Fukomys damarensis]
MAGVVFTECLELGEPDDRKCQRKEQAFYVPGLGCLQVGTEPMPVFVSMLGYSCGGGPGVSWAERWGRCRLLLPVLAPTVEGTLGYSCGGGPGVSWAERWGRCRLLLPVLAPTVEGTVKPMPCALLSEESQPPACSACDTMVTAVRAPGGGSVHVSAWPQCPCGPPEGFCGWRGREGLDRSATPAGFHVSCYSQAGGPGLSGLASRCDLGPCLSSQKKHGEGCEGVGEPLPIRALPLGHHCPPQEEGLCPRRRGAQWSSSGGARGGTRTCEDSPRSGRTSVPECHRQGSSPGICLFSTPRPEPSESSAHLEMKRMLQGDLGTSISLGLKAPQLPDAVSATSWPALEARGSGGCSSRAHSHFLESTHSGWGSWASRRLGTELVGIQDASPSRAVGGPGTMAEAKLVALDPHGQDGGKLLDCRPSSGTLRPPGGEAVSNSV